MIHKGDALSPGAPIRFQVGETSWPGVIVGMVFDHVAVAVDHIDGMITLVPCHNVKPIPDQEGLERESPTEYWVAVYLAPDGLTFVPGVVPHDSPQSARDSIGSVAAASLATMPMHHTWTVAGKKLKAGMLVDFIRPEDRLVCRGTIVNLAPKGNSRLFQIDHQGETVNIRQENIIRIPPQET